MEARRVTVIGGANTDICGMPEQHLLRHDSNPGRVSLRHGGVGRNIACNLCRLGLSVQLLTAVGDDLLGGMLLESCRAEGLDMSLSRVVPGMRSSVYLYLTDERGEMDAAVADMEVTAQLTPDYLAARLPEINTSDAVVLDANLSAETIAFLAEEIRVPLYADAVSTAKAPRLRAALGRMAALKPNLLEARTLTGCDSAEDCAAALLGTGLGRVYLSLGAGGILAAAGKERVHLPCRETAVVNTTGAGDAATAAIVWAELNGLGLAEAAMAANLAAGLTVACDETISPQLSPQLLLE